MLFDAIEKEYEENFIVLKGINANIFISDIRRIYKYSLDPTEPKKTKLFFNIVHSGMFFKKLAIKFHRYFALEMYFIFDKLYDITQRSMYKELCDVLAEEPNVKKHFTPILELPSNVTKVLDGLKVPLFPFQRAFMESFYNAREKLGLHGYILAFEAGLGKTFTAIAALYAFNIYPAIITAPKSTLDGWKKSILKMIPGVKDEEVILSYDYKPSMAKKWKFFICNYERLEMAMNCSITAVSPPQAIVIDESHNFRYMNTHRCQMLLNVKQQLDIKNVIAISGTPIKALAAELVPIMKLIDPDFDDEAEIIFKRIYSRSNYDPITGSVLRQRLSLFIERRKQEESIKLPPLEKYNVNVKLNDPTEFLIPTVKANVWKYVNERIPEHKALVKPNYEKLLELLENRIITENLSREEITQYTNIVKIKMNNPLSEEAIAGSSIVKAFELEKVRPLNSALFKEINQVRKQCTSYMQILLGKAMGTYFTNGKIKLISQMVKENVDEIAKIIREGELKTIIFATFIEPLHSVKEALESVGIGCILHTGGDDIRITREQFKNDNTIQAFLGTVQAVGTGKYLPHNIVIYY